MKKSVIFIASVFLCLLLIMGPTACRKATTASQNDVLTTISSRTAVTGQDVRVTLTRDQINDLKQGKMIRVLKTEDGNFITPGATTDDTNAGISFNPGNGGEVVWGGPGNCPPISAATLQYYQNQANACCCSFAVCLQGEFCYYYMCAFSPNNGCGNGGGGGGGFELQ
jgi:hypothetical protein